MESVRIVLMHRVSSCWLVANGCSLTDTDPPGRPRVQVESPSRGRAYTVLDECRRRGFQTYHIQPGKVKSEETHNLRRIKGAKNASSARGGRREKSRFSSKELECHLTLELCQITVFYLIALGRAFDELQE